MNKEYNREVAIESIRQLHKRIKEKESFNKTRANLISGKIEINSNKPNKVQLKFKK